MPRRHLRMCGLACSLFLGACAPTIISERSGDREMLGRHDGFRFADESLEQGVREAVRGELVRLGLRERPDAPLLVTITRSERRRDLGILPGNCDRIPALAVSASKRQPFRSGRLVMVAVTISEVGNGRIYLQGVAARRGGSADLGDLAPSLARAALSAPLAPSATISTDCLP